MTRSRTFLESLTSLAPWSQALLLPQLIGLGVLLLLCGQYGAVALLLPVVRTHLSSARMHWRRRETGWPLLAGRVAILLLVVLGLTLAVVRLEAQVPAPSAESCRDSLPAIYDRIAPAVVSIGAMAINPYDSDRGARRAAAPAGMSSTMIRGQATGF